MTKPVKLTDLTTNEFVELIQNVLVKIKNNEVVNDMPEIPKKIIANNGIMFDPDGFYTMEGIIKIFGNDKSYNRALNTFPETQANIKARSLRSGKFGYYPKDLIHELFELYFLNSKRKSKKMQLMRTYLIFNGAADVKN